MLWTGAPGDRRKVDDITSGLMHRVVAEWASSVRVHARCDLSLFRTPIASQCGIHQKIIPIGTIITRINAIIHSIFFCVVHLFIYVVARLVLPTLQVLAGKSHTSQMPKPALAREEPRLC